MSSGLEQTIKALQSAIQMEIDGKKYYEQMSQQIGNELGSRLFSQLAIEEDYHRQKFESIFKVIQKENTWPEVQFNENQGKTLKNIFSKASLKLTSKSAVSSSEKEAVQKAMTMENKTLDYYKECSLKSNFKAEKKYYETLAGEESSHHAVLLDYFEYINDPANWFTMKERHSLDGG
jgi:rubrerythrin